MSHKTNPMNDITALMATMKAAAARAAAAISDYDRGRIDVLEKRLAVEEYEKLVSEPANVLALVEALDKAQQRIAELESRTVTVKLPSWFVKDAIAVYDRDEIEEALTAAGIQVIEGGDV